MSLTSSLGTFFAPTEAANVKNQHDALAALLAQGSPYYDAGNLQLATPGSKGNALVNAAAGIKSSDVGVNYQPIDQDTDALNQLASTYYDQFAHGGKAEAAARNRAVTSMADAGGGGIEGARNLLTASQQLSGQAEQTALQERGAAGAAANENALQAGMLAIRKTALQAAVTHANIQKNLAAQAALNSLQNTQTDNDIRLRQGAVTGQHTLNMNDIAQTQAQNQIGQAVVGGLVGAVSQGAATGAQAFGSSVDVPQLSDSEVQNAANNTLAQYNVDPSTLPSAASNYATTGQEAAQVTQDALTKALNVQSSKISFPTLQSDAAQYLTDPSYYPLTTSVRS